MAGFERFSSGIQYSEHKTILSEKNKNADGRGAFARGASVRFEIDAPKNTVSVSMIMISDDDGSIRDFALAKTGNRYGFTLDTGAICGNDGGLFFYKYRINTSDGTYDMIKNELDGSEIIADKSDSFVDAFQLLIYIRRKKYPKWMHGGVMYQIFPDRFCKGGDFAPRADAKLQSPGEIPEFAENGQPILNNNFFGGDLAGVESKLDYLSSLGVNVIYFNPIFEAYSNHRYDTGNYMKIDGMLGGEEAFASLIKAAKKRGIRVILDGVFNHTGSDSVYFNRQGKYDSVGAYQSEKSPYFKWYNFKKFPDKYECWWDFATLPRVRCDEPSYRKFICGKDGVIRKYIKAGVSGWRLDVADEVSDGFLKELKSAAAS
ncbi:MAG: hypothetical protein KBS59_07795, partial [Clostridiales bacterium]|nr:hypothetical protein [Clostridiales bacterium]